MPASPRSAPATRPHIMQVFEVGTATMMGAKGAIKPVHELMKEAGEKFDPNAYLPAITGYYSTAKGEMLSFPFNSSSMVMWINKDALKKANVEIPKTWPEVFEAAKKLKAAGSATCGFSSAWTTWAMLEQFSAWHNVPLATKANGLDGFDTELKINSPLHVKHLQTPDRPAEGQDLRLFGPRQRLRKGRFTSGECPIFLTSSGFFGNVKANAKFDYTSVPMPYLSRTSPGAPQNSIIGGASLVGDGRQDAGRIQGRREVLRLPVDTDRQAKLHQELGYLPITKAAYEKTKASGFYEKNPILQTPLNRADQQGADRKLPRPSPRQHGRRCATSGRKRSKLRLAGQKSAPRTPSTRPSAAATSSCASSSGPLPLIGFPLNAILPGGAGRPGLIS